jgi:uncharacterized protein YbjT (DUF2867 family)
MTTAVIGATGHVGSEIVRGLLERGDAVAALVRDCDEAHRIFGEPDGLHVRSTLLDDRRDVTEAFEGIRTVFMAMGSVGIQGVLQRVAVSAAAAVPSIEQVTRVSVLNASADSPGSTSEPTTASTGSLLRPQSRTRRSAPRSSSNRCLPQRLRYAPRAHGPVSPAVAVRP